MVLEATMVVLDNSEWMRNGDYLPNRLEAMKDAVNLVCSRKTQSNPENTVGLLSAAGSGPQVLTTPTADMGRILAALHSVAVRGQADLMSALQIAQLALKHRQNKNQRQRIIAFVGSPVEAEKNKLVKLGKKLKKNNVSVDIISFGETDANDELLTAFLGAVNSSDTSHLVTVPTATPPVVLGDAVRTSAVLAGDGGAGAGMGGGGALGGGGGGGGFEFGVDPAMDPELAMALRMSMQDEEERQRRAREQEVQGSGGDGDATVTDAAPAEAADGGGGGGGDVAMDMADMANMDEDAMLQLAMQMSMAEYNDGGGAGADEGAAGGDAEDAAMGEAGLALPGVDANDPAVRDALDGAEGGDGDGAK